MRSPPDPGATATAEGPAATRSAGGVVDQAAPTPARTGGARRTTNEPVAAGRELAIPDYDSLSASQVLPRLAGLTPTELEAVRAHEGANRGRKTILNKVDQLQGS